MLRTIFKWLGWILLGLIVLTVSFVIWGNKNGWEFDAVLSGSMEPEYEIGGLVVIKPVGIATLKIGDVISFKLPGINTPICHRIIDIRYLDNEQYFQTQGDANEFPDRDMIPACDIKGKSVLFIPLVGKLAEIKKYGTIQVTLLGIKLPLAIPVIAVIGLLFIGLTLKDIRDYIFEPNRQKRKELHKKRQQFLYKRRKALRP